MRNLGSSIGISITGALLQINTQVNHAILASNATPFNRNFQLGAIPHFWDLHSAHGAAAFNQEITKQAQIIAYVDNFKLMFVLAIIALPLVLLTRRPRPR
jgi:DHA2 family multidrug resistance protein